MRDGREEGKASLDFRKVDSFASPVKLVKRNFPPRISAIKSSRKRDVLARALQIFARNSTADFHPRAADFLPSPSSCRDLCRRRYFFSFFRAEPRSSLRHRGSQDRVRGERRGRLVEQMRLHRGPSSGIRRPDGREKGFTG